jgi:hypothetical protein
MIVRFDPLEVTVREIVEVCDKLPEAPVMVTVTVTVAAAADALSVRMLELLATALKDAVTPFGRPEAVRLTVWLKPLVGLMVMVAVPLAP